jgi:hypothetical protein
VASNHAVCFIQLLNGRLFVKYFKEHLNAYNISGVIYEVVKELSGSQVLPPDAVAICQLGSGTRVLPL